MPRLSFSVDNASDFDDAMSCSSDFLDIPEDDVQAQQHNYQGVPVAEDAPRRLARRSSVPPLIDGHPVVLLGSCASIDLGEEMNQDLCAEAKRIRIEVLADFWKDASFGTFTFGPSWGALLKLGARPQKSPVFGRPSLPDAVSDIAWRSWLRNAGFFTFLRAVGVLRRGQAVPRNAEEFRATGVVPIKDDLFCGFWCLARLIQCDLSELFKRLVTELCHDRLLASKARDEKRSPSNKDLLWEKVWAIATFGLQRLEMGIKSGMDWDLPLLPEEEAKGQCGHAGAFVISKLREQHLSAEVMLTTEELSSLCARLSLKIPIVTIATADTYYGEAYAKKMLVAAVQEELRQYPELDVDNDDHDERVHDASTALRHNGYQLIVADAVLERSALPGPEQLQGLTQRPLVILLGDHFFILEERLDVQHTTTSQEPVCRKRKLETLEGGKKSESTPRTEPRTEPLTLDMLRKQAGA